jgi:hypothetical protein
MWPEKLKFLRWDSRYFHVYTVAFLLSMQGFLYCFLFLPAFLPVEGNGFGDIFIYLSPAQRMYQGELIYRDVFEFVTPGIALFNLLMFKLFGLRVWIPNLSVMLLGLGLTWLGVVISRRLMRPGLALIPSFIFLIATREYIYDPTHHWYSLLAATGAIAILLERRSPARIAVAGALFGLSSCFTQSRGLSALAGLTIFLVWESWQLNEGWRSLLKKSAWLLAGFVAVLVAVNGYFVWKVGLSRFLWSTVVFVLEYYPKHADINSILSIKDSLPEFDTTRHFIMDLGNWLILFVAVPLTYVCFFIQYWRKSRQCVSENWTRLMLLAIVGFFMLLGTSPSPKGVRMAAISLPAFILLVWLLDFLGKPGRILLVILTSGTLIVALHAVIRGRPIPVGILNTSQGDLAFTERTRFEEIVWFQQHTQPQDYYYGPVLRQLYFYLDLRNPTPYSIILNSGYTTEQQVTECVQGLELRKPRYILWNPLDLDQIPAWENPADDHLGPLRNYMRRHYEVVKVFESTDEAWQRKDE